MPWSALPDHINEPHEWDGKDDDKLGWWGRFRKAHKGWFAFGPRATEWWARWREVPRILYAIRGNGSFRFENTDGTDTFYDDCCNPYPHKGWLTEHNYYLSRVQLWCDWHIGLQWPLFLHGHFRGWQFYIGFKRDADRVYWLAGFLGRVWK